MDYRVIIADDEEVARSRLRRLLNQNFDMFKIVAEANNGASARDAIIQLKPDLVFLDIEMPEMIGTEVAQIACKNIFVIFVTAYNQYAIEAFKSLAIDYILKPIGENDLRNAINKFLAISKPPSFNVLYEQLAQQLSSPGRSNKIRVTSGDTIKFISHDEIICFEADQKYTTIFTLVSNYVTDLSLRELELALPKNEFVRIHRKHIINVNMISEIKRFDDRQFKVFLKVPFNRELIVSRNYRDNIFAI
jgi:two-component system LytT family response regulator